MPDDTLRDSIYLPQVLEQYRRPYHRGSCPVRTHGYQGDNDACHDTIRVEVQIDDGVLRQIYFDGDGCCLSQAVASMLAKRLEGRTVAEVQQFPAEQVLDWIGTPLPAGRRECALLPWRALREVVAAIGISPCAGAG